MNSRSCQLKTTGAVTTCRPPGSGSGIRAGEAIANVELDAKGVRLVAAITVEAVRDLGLAEGSEVTAVIKASEVILATGS